jgi:hypothetical protein
LDQRLDGMLFVRNIVYTVSGNHQRVGSWLQNGVTTVAMATMTIPYGCYYGF